MNSHQIVSIQRDRPHGLRHSIITSVHTVDTLSSEERVWTLRAVLEAMNRAERFFTLAPNGRSARVQRYDCGKCSRAHIRTHVSDVAIHALELLPGYAQT